MSARSSNIHHNGDWIIILNQTLMEKDTSGSSIILQRISSRRARRSTNFTTTPSMFTRSTPRDGAVSRTSLAPRRAVFQPSGLQCSVRVHPKSHRRCDVRRGTHAGSEERAGWPRFTLRDGVLPACGSTECPHARAECPRARHALARVFVFSPSLSLHLSFSLSFFCFLSPFFVVFLMCLLLPFVSSVCQSVLFMCSLLYSCSRVFLIVYFFESVLAVLAVSFWMLLSFCHSLQSHPMFLCDIPCVPSECPDRCPSCRRPERVGASSSLNSPHQEGPYFM